MRICLIGSCHHPVREPFAGGLEALTHALASGLAGRGHEVTLFAGAGSDPDLPVTLVALDDFTPSAAALRDANAPTARFLAEHHAYLGLMLWLAQHGSEFDLVHNNSLHHLPVAMAPSLPMPLVTTLHTPALPWLESALALAPQPLPFTAVSECTARGWAHATRSTVIRNGVDLESWRPGPGGGPAVWSGRLVPEKAPHEAIEACRRAGTPLTVIGPVHDTGYFEAEVEPLLGDAAHYAGHLSHGEVRRHLASASVAVVTPAWDEPYGLVVAEAMACGTPVAGYDRGAVAEVAGTAGMLARAGDVDDLARAVVEASRLDRAEVRRHAERICSRERMVGEYEECYRAVLRETTDRRPA